MTTMTETGRTLTSGWCSLQRGCAVLERGASPAVAAISLAHVFALRGKCGAPDMNAAEDRAFLRRDDS